MDQLRVNFIFNFSQVKTRLCWIHVQSDQKKKKNSISKIFCPLEILSKGLHLVTKQYSPLNRLLIYVNLNKHLLVVSGPHYRTTGLDTVLLLPSWLTF